jgi:hydroxylysine kinase
MTGPLEQFAAPFERVDPGRAADLLAAHWRLDGAPRLGRLDTERDDTFAVRAGDDRGVLKIAHPRDDPDELDAQTAALDHLARRDPALPVPRVRRTRTGASSAALDGRHARLLSWLPGVALLDAPRSDAQLRAAGAALGRIAHALADFDHPGAHRVLAWDITRLPDLAAVTADPLLGELIARFAAETAPALAALPHQVIHNDFHPGNLFVDPDDPERLTGVIDFGDLVHTARVVDLGVALCYLVPDEGEIRPALTPFLAGYESIVPLRPSEHALLPALIVARQVQRIVLGAALARDPGDVREGLARATRRLHRLLDERIL